MIGEPGAAPGGFGRMVAVLVGVTVPGVVVTGALRGCADRVVLLSGAGSAAHGSGELA
jgi:hypothetical protein